MNRGEGGGKVGEMISLVQGKLMTWLLGDVHTKVS